MSDYYLRRQDPVAAPASVAGVNTLLDWAEKLAEAAAPQEVYRHKEGRITLRFEHEGRGYFLKLHRGIGWGEILKNLLQVRLPVVSASNEYRAVQTLRNIGVDTLEVAAYARQGGNPATVKSLLVSDELVGTISLEHYCADWAVASPAAVLRRRLIRSLAESARKMHDAGINHRDFYLCHFHLDLASLETPRLRCYLIDLHRAQLRARTPRRWRIKDLAGLYFSALECGLSRRDLLRFMHHYSEGGLAAALGPEVRLWRQVERKAKALERKAERQRRSAGSGASWRIIRGRDRGRALGSLLANHEQDLRQWLSEHSRLLKQDQWSEVGLVELQGKWCFIKLYLAKSPLQRLAFRMRRARAVRSFDAAQAMAVAGLPVPGPRACLALNGAMVLLTEGMPNGRDLRALWLAEPAAADAAQWLAAAAELLARMHRAGFAHGDCKWSNLLWSGGQFYLVDLEAVQQLTPLTGKPAGLHPRQASDLARFTIDAEELALAPDLYQLFLERYLACTGLARESLLLQLLPLVERTRARHRRKYAIDMPGLV